MNKKTKQMVLRALQKNETLDVRNAVFFNRYLSLYKVPIDIHYAFYDKYLVRKTIYRHPYYAYTRLRKHVSIRTFYVPEIDFPSFV